MSVVAKTAATLRVMGEDLDPSEITRLLALGERGIELDLDVHAAQLATPPPTSRKGDRMTG